MDSSYFELVANICTAIFSSLCMTLKKELSLVLRVLILIAASLGSVYGREGPSRLALET